VPAQIGVGALATVAAAGVVTAAGFGLRAVSGSSTAASSSGSAADSGKAPATAPLPATDSPSSAPDSWVPTAGGKRSPASRLNLCGYPLATPAASPTGLRLSVDFPAAAPASGTVGGRVMLTNTSTATVSGEIYENATITLSSNGIVLWHTPESAEQFSPRTVVLAPGKSIFWDASFQPAACGIGDDPNGDLRTDLPWVTGGRYRLSAAIDVTVGSNSELVTGPEAGIRLK
jgi:hypothetical protein